MVHFSAFHRIVDSLTVITIVVKVVMSHINSVSIDLLCGVTLVSRDCFLLQCPRLDKVAQSHQQAEEVDQDPRSKDQTSPPVSRPRWHM